MFLAQPTQSGENMTQGITTESDIAQAVVDILAVTPNGEATLAHLRKRLRSTLNLTAADLSPSLTRRNETLWEQRLRNIKSHHASPGNYIAEGYLTAPSRGRLRITVAGRKIAR